MENFAGREAHGNWKDESDEIALYYPGNTVPGDLFVCAWPTDRWRMERGPAGSERTGQNVSGRRPVDWPLNENPNLKRPSRANRPRRPA